MRKIFITNIDNNKHIKNRYICFELVDIINGNDVFYEQLIASAHWYLVGNWWNLLLIHYNLFIIPLLIPRHLSPIPTILCHFRHLSSLWRVLLIPRSQYQYILEPMFQRKHIYYDLLLNMAIKTVFMLDMVTSVKLGYLLSLTS